MQLFENILVVVDSSAETHRELDRALQLVDQTDARIHLIDIVMDVSLTVRLLSHDYAHIHELLIKEKQEELESLVAHCKSHGIDATGEVLQGPSSLRTIETAKRLGCDLIIRSAKGAQSREQGILGSSAKKLMRQPPCAVWLTQPKHEPKCKTIIATVDATPDDEAHASLNRSILETAQALARRDRCRLLVSYAWSLYGADMLKHRLPDSEYETLIEHNRKLHMESFEKLLSQYDLHAAGPNARMLEGEPSSAIPELCQTENADLLICGTVARHGIAGLLLGNTAERIINRVECSILAITPPN